MRVHCREQYRQQEVIIRNAYYVPDQPLDILSSWDVRKIGGATIFDDNQRRSCVRWPTPQGDIYQDISWHNNLPYITVSGSVSVNVIRKSVPAGLGFDLTHATFGHMGTDKLKLLAKEGYLEQSIICAEQGYACDHCDKANARLNSYPSNDDLRATHVNHTLHADLLHFPVSTPDGYQYVLTVIDEYTRYAFVALIAKKSDAAPQLLRIMKRAYVLKDVKVKNLRNDQGGEFESQVMRVAKEELGIASDYVPARCHASNGLVERLHSTIARTVRVVLQQSKVPFDFWGEAVLYAVHLYNLTPHTALRDRKASSTIPWKLYLNDSDERVKRLYEQLVPFGIQCNIIQTGDKPKDVKKLDPRAVPGLVVGYGPSTKQYRVVALIPQAPFKVYIVRHIIVNGRHFQEYFSRTQTPSDLRHYTGVYCTDILTESRVVLAAVNTSRISIPDVVVNSTALPAQSVSRGSDHAVITRNTTPDRSDDGEKSSNNASAHSEAPEQEMDGSEGSQNKDPFMATEDMHSRSMLDPPRIMSELKRWRIDMIEPSHQNPYMTAKQKIEINRLRNDWVKYCRNVKVCHTDGCVHIHINMHDVKLDSETVTDTDSVSTLHADRDGGDSGSQGVHSRRCSTEAPEDVVIRELWHIQAVKVWATDPDSPSFEEAINGPNRNYWLDALSEEGLALREHDTYEVVDRPHGQNVIKGKPVCKIKRDSSGNIERFKIRYVGCGYAQTEGIDYFEHQVWAPTGQHATLRVLIVHAATHNLNIRHIDISTAFLHGELNETVYIEQPPIINDGTDRVWKLKRSLYGLKQAGRQWHQKLSSELKKLGFERAGYDPALFIRKVSGEKQFIFIWVDDLIIFATRKACDEIVEHVFDKFKGRDLGEATWVLGMSIKRDRSKGIVELSQQRMIVNVLERFGQNKDERTIKVPLEMQDGPVPDPHDKSREKQKKLLIATSDKDVVEKIQKKLNAMDVDATPLSRKDHSEYMSIVGTIQYIAVVTRPDISFAAASLAKYMSCPTHHLMGCAKRVLRYLSATQHHVLRYECGSHEKKPDLIGYSDADFAGCSTTSRSTSGIAILYRGQPVHWRSKRQPIVTSSTTEAELVALNLCALQVQWLKLLLGEDLGVGPLTASMFCDNQSTVKIAHNPVASDRTRHIKVKHRKIQELITHQTMSVEWINTKEQVADIFTKQMNRLQFEYLRDKMHVRESIL